MKVKPKNLLLVSANLIILILVNGFFEIIEPLILYVDLIRYQALMAILVTTWGVLSSYWLNKELSFFSIFYIFCLIFYFGQPILLLLGNNLGDSFLTITSGSFSYEQIYNTQNYELNCMMFLNIGYLLTASNWTRIDKRGNQDLLYNHSDVSRKILRNVGLFLLIISIIPAFYVQIIELSEIQLNGYGATINANYSFFYKIGKIISGYFTSALLILFITEKSKKELVIPIIVTGTYFAIYLAGGSRVNVIQMVVAIFFIEYYWTKRIRKRDFPKLVILLFLALTLMSFVSSIRLNLAYTNNLSGLIKETLKTTLSNNVIHSVLRETGITEILNIVVYENTPKIYDYQYGYSFIKAFLSIFPNFTSGVHPASISTESLFSPLYTSLCLLGSSFVAESYFNFGKWAYFFMVLYGYGLAFLWKKFKVSIINRKYILFFVVIYLYQYIIYLVRTDINGFGRSFVYFCLIPIFLFLINFNYLKRRNNL